jgi:hypothetical protein
MRAISQNANAVWLQSQEVILEFDARREGGTPLRPHGGLLQMKCKSEPCSRPGFAR